jgi:hypothetical protein
VVPSAAVLHITAIACTACPEELDAVLRRASAAVAALLPHRLVLDQLLARLEQCFIHSGEIHPCRTFCPYQQDNECFFTETAGPDRLLHVDTRLG